MRGYRSLLFASVAFCASSGAHAADTLQFGATPAWVVPQVIPPASDKTKDRPVAVLLHDQQSLLEPGKISTFSELAFKIQKPEGLAAGNLSIAWNPAFDTATVNRLEIHRGDQVIDVLKSGQTFTTMRRESNLEMAMLDGVLTANIQPEGLQEGDIVVLAYTDEHSDPTLKGHVEAIFAPWGEAQIGLAHARLAWPSAIDVKIQKTGDLPASAPSVRDGKKIFEVTMRDLEPVIAPKGAPVRFKIGRMGEATDFRSWADAARLMAPLYRDAAVIPATGPLRDEVEKIRKASTDPKARTEQALQLVQQRIRYVALAMGQGGLVPASAETTWSRRFGDCKAKTALLLAILHEFGISAEPVLANALGGDMVADRLPMLGVFNHVLVRAHVTGKDYWLDGTRTGDKELDEIQVPNFGWGLPLVEKAALVHIVPPPLQAPDSETRIAIDASAGVFAPAKVEIEQVIRGDAAVGFDRLYAQMSAEQQTEYLHADAKHFFDSISGDSSTTKFDEAKRELRISTTGTAKLDWKDGWYSVPSSSIAFNPDFDRPPGPQHDAPIATSYPNFDERAVTIKLPPGFATAQKRVPQPVHETLAGVEYQRTMTLAGDELKIESSERSMAPEVPYKSAVLDAPRLRALDRDDVYLQVPGTYQPTKVDLAAMTEQQPSTAEEYKRRAGALLSAGKADQAIPDLTSALALEPKNASLLASRAFAYVATGDRIAAQQDIDAALAIEPDNMGALRARGILAQTSGDSRTAAEIFGKLVKDHPDDFADLGPLANANHALGKDDDALAQSAEALKHRPGAFDIRLLRANIFRARGDQAAAFKEAELLISENPKQDYAIDTAARIFAAAGARDRAMQVFDQAIASKPSVSLYLNRSSVRPKADIAGRAADIDAALKLESDNVGALAMKAQLLSSGGDYEGALEILDRAKSAPNNSYVDAQRAIVLYKAGRRNDAQKILSELRSRAKSPAELNNLCWVKATEGMALDSALQDCRDALKLSPEVGGYLDSLGMVLLKLGRLDEALDAYNKAVAKDTGADSLMGRAFVYLRKGDRTHAEADAAAARKLYATIDDTFADYGLKFDEKSAASSH